MEGHDYTERVLLGKYFNLDWGIFLMGEAEQLCSNYFGQGLKISDLKLAVTIFSYLALDFCQNPVTQGNL